MPQLVGNAVPLPSRLVLIDTFTKPPLGTITHFLEGVMVLAIYTSWGLEEQHLIIVKAKIKVSMDGQGTLQIDGSTRELLAVSVT